MSLVYGPGAGFPAGADSQVGVLVSEYSGSTIPYFEKLIEAGAPMTHVTVAGRWPGLYFATPHEVVVRSSTASCTQISPGCPHRRSCGYEAA